MIFEEALKLMREGKKIRHPYMGEDEYLTGCYVYFGLYDELGMPRNPTTEEFEEAKTRGISIVKMKGDRQHPDMIPKNFPKRQTCCDPDLHSMPQINLFYLISDDWEVVE